MGSSALSIHLRLPRTFSERYGEMSVIKPVPFGLECPLAGGLSSVEFGLAPRGRDE
jgi:hypothetical protein